MVEVGFRQVGVGLLPKFLGGGAADVLSKIGAGESEAKMAGVFAGQCAFKVITVIGDIKCFSG